LADTQLPTDGDANVAFMATVGSTQRVISRSCKRCLVLRCAATSSSVRTKCHMPFRKLGPSNPTSALACDASGPTLTPAMKTAKAAEARFEVANRLRKLIPIAPIVPVSATNLINGAFGSTSNDYPKRLILSKG
jgi:hypothetical protein